MKVGQYSAWAESVMNWDVIRQHRGVVLGKNFDSTGIFKKSKSPFLSKLGCNKAPLVSYVGQNLPN